MTHPSGSTPRVPRWFLILAALILVPPLLQFALNLTPVREAIQRQVTRVTGIEVAALRIRFVPRPHVELMEVVVHDPVRREPELRARRVDLTLDLRSLMRGDLALARIRILAPQMVVRRDPQGQWHLPFAARAAPPGGAEPMASRAPMRFPRIEITDGEALLVDERLGQALDPIRVTGFHLIALDRNRGQTADLEMTGQVQGTPTPSSFHVAGSVAWADLGSGVASDSSAGEMIPVQFSGQVSLHDIDTQGWLRRLGAPTALPDGGRGDLTAQVVLSPGPAGYDVRLAQTDLRLDWLGLRGEGWVQGLGSDQPQYAVTLASTPFGFESLVQHVPVLWIDPSIKTFLVEQEGAATLEVISATVRGRVGAPQPDEWKGVAKVSHGHALLGDDRVPINEASGTLFLDPHTLEASDLRGLYGPIRITAGKVTVSHLQVAPTLDVEAAGESQAGDLLDLLRRVGTADLQRVLRDRVGEATGELRLSIRLTGGLSPKPDVALVRAEVSGHGVAVQVPQLPQAVEQLDVEAIVTPRLLEVRRLDGVMGPLRFKTNGAVALEPRAKMEEVSLLLEGQGEALLPLLSIRPESHDTFGLTGPIQIKATLDGLLSAPRFKGVLELDRAALLVAPVIDKPVGVQTAVKFAGHLAEGGRLTFSRLDLRLPFVRLDGSARVRLEPPYRFKVRLATGPVSITRLASGFSAGPLKEGVLTLTVDAKGRWRDWAASRFNGWVELREGVIQEGGMKDPLHDVMFRVNLADQDVNIGRLAFKIRDSDVRLRGTIKRWLRKPDLVLTVESSKLDLSRLLSRADTREAGEPFLDRLRRWAHSGFADVGLILSQVRYHQLLVTKLSGHLRMGEGQIHLQRFSGDTKEGVIAAEASLDLRAAARADLAGTFRIDGVPVHHVLSLFEPDEEILRGRVSVAGALQGVIGGTSPFLKTLQSRAPIILRLERGKVVHGTVLPKVLKILNVPALLEGTIDLDREGIPYDSISATVTVREGVLSAQDIVFDSPILKISGAGTFDAVTEQLDVGLAVSPLGAYADTISSIPLFGQLLAGDRPGLTTALFEVKGSYRDPDVRYLPVESIAKGLTGYPRLAIDVLTNLLMLPQTLTSPSRP